MQMNIPAMFGPIFFSGSLEEDWNVYGRRRTPSDGNSSHESGELNIWWKKSNKSKKGNQIYFKIGGYVDLEMLNMFAV